MPVISRQWWALTAIRRGGAGWYWRHQQQQRRDTNRHRTRPAASRQTQSTQALGLRELVEQDYEENYELLTNWHLCHNMQFFEKCRLHQKKKNTGLLIILKLFFVYVWMWQKKLSQQAVTILPRAADHKRLLAYLFQSDQHRSLLSLKCNLEFTDWPTVDLEARSLLIARVPAGQVCQYEISAAVGERRLDGWSRRHDIQNTTRQISKF